MTDQVFWHEGERTARVPIDCVRAVVAAARNADRVQPATCVAVFTALALHAGANGEGARPKVDTIADLLDLSAAQVRRVINVLVEAGVCAKKAVVVNGRKVGNTYTLTRPQVQTPIAPPGAPPIAPPGAPQSRPQARSIEQPVEQPIEQPKPVARPTNPVARDDAFEQFWTAYPRKTAKGAARKAWPAAVKAAESPEQIIAGAARYAADPNRDDRYTAHASTWLRAERWGDEPEPPRTGRAPAQRIDTNRDTESGRLEL